MNPARIAIILVAGVAAICLAIIVRNIAAKPPAPPAPVIAAQAPAQPMTRVLVAKVDLAVGQTLTQDNMAWQAWPAATVNAAYVTDGVVATAAPTPAAGAISKAKTTVNDMATGGGPKMQAMMGAIVREAVYAGEPITSIKVVRSGDSSYMAVRLPEGTRAYSLPLTVESGAGGFIEPGDRIDLLSTHADTAHTGAGNAPLVTETVLSNVLVLAIDQHTDTPKAGQAQPGATITLEVPAFAVSNVARARTQGGLTMALRSYADIAGRTSGPSANDGRTVRLFKGGGSAELVTTQ